MSGFERHYPDGRLNGDDEGAVEMKVFTDKNNVIIQFANPVGWLGLPKEVALQLSGLIKAHADKLP